MKPFHVVKLEIFLNPLDNLPDSFVIMEINFLIFYDYDIPHCQDQNFKKKDKGRLTITCLFLYVLLFAEIYLSRRPVLL